MTCKDCIHVEMCHLESCYQDERFEDKYNIETYCEEFKNKADFVEVVRCKNCRYNKPTDYEGKSACIRQCAYKKPDDFCSYGERKQ